MVRKQVYITQEQDELLKRLSDDLLTTEADLIRRGIDLIEAEFESEEARRRFHVEDLIAFMEDHARQHPEGGSAEKWNREDAYDDERHARLFHRH